jgi:hypothetical protein
VRAAFVVAGLVPQQVIGGLRVTDEKQLHNFVLKRKPRRSQRAQRKKRELDEKKDATEITETSEKDQRI